MKRLLLLFVALALCFTGCTFYFGDFVVDVDGDRPPFVVTLRVAGGSDEGLYTWFGPWGEIATVGVPEFSSTVDGDLENPIRFAYEWTDGELFFEDEFFYFMENRPPEIVARPLLAGGTYRNQFYVTPFRKYILYLSGCVVDPDGDAIEVKEIEILPFTTPWTPFQQFVNPYLDHVLPSYEADDIVWDANPDALFFPPLVPGRVAVYGEPMAVMWFPLYKEKVSPLTGLQYAPYDIGDGYICDSNCNLGTVDRQTSGALIRVTFVDALGAEVVGEWIMAIAPISC